MTKNSITDELIAKESEKLKRMELQTEQQRQHLEDLKNQMKIKKFDEVEDVLSAKGISLSKLMKMIERGDFSPYPELKQPEA